MAIGIEERAEVLELIERLEDATRELAVRGLRAAGSEQLGLLEHLGAELSRLGAEHLAAAVEELVRHTREDSRGAASALLRARVSLRLFERLLTLEAVGEDLGAWLEPEDEV